jgi:hypothetical protein
MSDLALHSQPQGPGRGGPEGDRRFRELDDLVLHLKGLVLVRDLRAGGGADRDELGMFGTEIDRARDRLARLVRDGTRWGRPSREPAESGPDRDPAPRGERTAVAALATPSVVGA